MSQATVYTFDEDCFSDLHKDAYGFRPNAAFFNWKVTATDDEKQAEWDSLVATMGQREEQRVEGERGAIVAFEANVQATIASGAKDRATSIRWLMDGAGIGNSDLVEYFEYCMGIPYGYVKKTNLSN